MAGLDLGALRKWVAFGMGAGVVAGEHDLEVTVVRVRPTGVRVVAETRIEGYRERPSAEWGAEYTKFLAGCGAAHVAALAVLPRREVVVRTIAMPGVKDEDAGAALAYQMEGLHPYREEDARSDWKRLNGTGSFLVAMAESATVEKYLSLFAEAGVKLSGLTVSAAVMHRALRLLGAPSVDGFVAVRGLAAGMPGPVEIYGESAARPLFSAEFEIQSEAAVALAASELRLTPETAAKDWAELLPSPARSENALAFAAAIVAACPHLGQPVNLLPAEQREVTSRARYAPTAVLGGVLALLCAALALQWPYQDRRYLGLLQGEIHKLEIPARQVDTLDAKTRDALARVQQLDEFRARSRQDLDLLLDLTKLVPPPAWVSLLQTTREMVQFTGEIEQAEGMLKTLDASPLLANSEFTQALAKSASGMEIFRIRAVRERRTK